MQKAFLLSVTMNGYPVLYSFLPEYFFIGHCLWQDTALEGCTITFSVAVFTHCSCNKCTELVYTGLLQVSEAAFHKLCVPKNRGKELWVRRVNPLSSRLGLRRKQQPIEHPQGDIMLPTYLQVCIDWGLAVAWAKERTTSSKLLCSMRTEVLSTCAHSCRTLK